jgi:hypothetical protein
LEIISLNFIFYLIFLVKPSSSSGSIFGGSQPNSDTGLFGSKPAAPVSGGLFGSSTTTSAFSSGGGGLFGSAKATTEPSGGGLFGSATPATAPTG